MRRTLTQYASPPRSAPETTVNSRNYNKNQTQDVATAVFIETERERLSYFFTIISSDPGDLLKEQELVISKRTGLYICFPFKHSVVSKSHDYLSNKFDISMNFLGFIKICSKAKQKFVELYEQMLWQNIGITAEHILLWWTDFALGRKNQLISQKFNAWLKQYYSTGKSYELYSINK